MSPSGSTQVEWTLQAPCTGEAECAACVAKLMTRHRVAIDRERVSPASCAEGSVVGRSAGWRLACGIGEKPRASAPFRGPLERHGRGAMPPLGGIILRTEWRPSLELCCELAAYVTPRTSTGTSLSLPVIQQRRRSLSVTSSRKKYSEKEMSCLRKNKEFVARPNRGRKFENRVAQILMTLVKIHPVTVAVTEHPRVTLPYRRRPREPDFELVYRLPHQTSHRLIECQSRNVSKTDIVDKIRSMKILSEKNRFIFVYENPGSVKKSLREDLEPDGIVHYDFEEFTIFVLMLSGTLQLTAPLMKVCDLADFSGSLRTPEVRIDIAADFMGVLRGGRPGNLNQVKQEIERQALQDINDAKKTSSPL